MITKFALRTRASDLARAAASYGCAGSASLPDATAMPTIHLTNKP
jgi:hypothetical protein